jgi:hypothetical protein
MPKSDRVLRIFVLDFEVFKIITDSIIEFEFAFLHLLQQCNRRHRFKGRAYEIHGAGGGGRARP